MPGLEERLRRGSGAGERTGGRRAAPTARLGADAARRGVSRRVEIEAFAPDEVRPWAYANRATSALDAESLRGLAESLCREGQMSPGLARRLPADAEHKAEVVFGRRRLEACRLAGLQWRARVLSEETPDAQCAAAMHAENDHAEGIGPLEDARVWARYLADGVFARQEDLARALGVSQSYVSRYLRASSILDCEWLRPLVEPVLGDVALRAALRIADALDDPVARRRGERAARQLAAEGARVPGKALFDRVFGGTPAGGGRRKRSAGRAGGDGSEAGASRRAMAVDGIEERLADGRGAAGGGLLERVADEVFASPGVASMESAEIAGALFAAALLGGEAGWDLQRCRDAAGAVAGASDRIAAVREALGARNSG